MDRESGYYWVKIKGEWIVAQWDKSMDWWVITGNEHLFYDSDFEEIDERRIVRGEATTLNINIAKVLSDAGLSSEENKAAIIELLKKNHSGTL